MKKDERSKDRSKGNLRIRKSNTQGYIKRASSMGLEDTEKDKDTRSPDGLFYSWECVSILMGTRSIDFVIKNRTYMLAFLKLLLTFAKQHEKLKNKKADLPFYKRPFVKSEGVNISKKNQVSTLKYKILMIHMKISYMCWV